MAAEEEMADYRIFFLDSDGHVRNAVEMDCENDEAAVAFAQEKFDGRCMELWQLGRMVSRLEATQLAPLARGVGRPKPGSKDDAQA